MKTLLSIALIFMATTVFATPFLECNPPPSGETRTHYIITGWSETNVVSQADGRLRMDVGSAVEGTTYALTISSCNVWGCSVATPFSLKKGLPSATEQLKLVP